jgi:hypothetical protein
MFKQIREFAAAPETTGAKACPKTCAADGSTACSARRGTRQCAWLVRLGSTSSRQHLFMGAGIHVGRAPSPAPHPLVRLGWACIDESMGSAPDWGDQGVARGPGGPPHKAVVLMCLHPCWPERTQSKPGRYRFTRITLWLDAEARMPPRKVVSNNQTPAPVSRACCLRSYARALSGRPANGQSDEAFRPWDSSLHLSTVDMHAVAGYSLSRQQKCCRALHRG